VLGQVIGLLALRQRLDLAAGRRVGGLEGFLDLGLGNAVLGVAGLAQVLAWEKSPSTPGREPSCGAMSSAICNVLELDLNNGRAGLRVP